MIIFPSFYALVLCGPELNGLSTVMKLVDNTESTEQSITKQGVETGQMNTLESDPVAGSTLAVHSEQPAPAIEMERGDLTAFFSVGIVINIVMVTAYFIWAYKQWRKTGTSNE